MNKTLYSLAAIAATLTLGSCQVEVLEIDTPQTTVHGFTLNASYGEPGTKAAFDDGALTMSWTPGDVLYMLDPEWTNSPVKLTTDITGPAKVAKFHTDEVIAAGNYIVVNTQNTLDAQLDEYSSLKDSPSGLNDLIRVYGSVAVEKGQTSADLTLHQLYTMLSFNFENIPAEMQNRLTLGMAVTTDGLPRLNQGIITSEGMETFPSGTFVYWLGEIKAETGHTLIAPADLRNGQIIFFAVGTDDYSNRHVYEIFKAGTVLQAGKCYSINFDFTASSTRYVKLEKASGGMVLKSADDFIAAALIQWTNSVQLQADVDFDCGFYLPLNASALFGNGHTLSSIQCNLSECNYVGVLSDGSVHNLNINLAYFTGANRVGAIAGRGYCESCTCTDVHVTGTDYVGGLVGYANYDMENCSLLGVSSIIGKDNVGGIVGYSSHDVKNCVAKGEYIEVSGSSYLGGIAGASTGALECGFEGIVYSSTAGNAVGGVTGVGPCTRCYSVGEVSGYDLVGGVSGSSGCTDCYHIGDVMGGTIASGCHVGGISGTDAASPEVSNCYFCGTVTGDCGICAGTPADALASTNLSSTVKLYNATDESLIDHCMFGTGRKFIDSLMVINANGAYYDLVWPDNEAGCPILKWQYEGFGGDVDIPGFEPVEL